VEHVNKHKRTLGILFICFAVLKIIFFTLGIQLISFGLQFLEDEAEVQFAAYIIKYVIGTILILYTIPSLLAGIGLINGKKWALILALILGIISLPVFPIGTGIGVYAIIVFLMDQSSYYKDKPGEEEVMVNDEAAKEESTEKKNEVRSI